MKIIKFNICLLIFLLYAQLDMTLLQGKIGYRQSFGLGKLKPKLVEIFEGKTSCVMLCMILERWIWTLCQFQWADCLRFCLMSLYMRRWLVFQFMKTPDPDYYLVCLIRSRQPQETHDGCFQSIFSFYKCLSCSSRYEVVNLPA